jgi:hypothetical protein
MGEEEIPSLGRGVVDCEMAGRGFVANTNSQYVQLYFKKAEK